jgi:hypothetical protein
MIEEEDGDEGRGRLKGSNKGQSQENTTGDDRRHEDS